MMNTSMCKHIMLHLWYSHWNLVGVASPSILPYILLDERWKIVFIPSSGSAFVSGPTPPSSLPQFLWNLTSVQVVFSVRRGQSAGCGGKQYPGLVCRTSQDRKWKKHQEKVRNVWTARFLGEVTVRGEKDRQREGKYVKSRNCIYFVLYGILHMMFYIFLVNKSRSLDLSKDKCCVHFDLFYLLKYGFFHTFFPQKRN